MKDLTGGQFGRLTVTRSEGSLWRCICICGRETLVRRWSLTSGRTRSCGCLLSETAGTKGRSRLIDLTGQQFGRLTVIRRADNQNGTRTAWQCRCTCGETFTTNASSLSRGLVNSCGCLRRNDHTVITYEAAHWRVRKAKGPASAHPCTDCSRRASHWSYNYGDPAALRQQGKGAYSLDPAHYEPRCPPCHKVYDLAHKTPRQTVSVHQPTH